MKLDPTLQKIFQEVQEEVKEEMGIDLSLYEIAEIVESQFHAAIIGINHGVGTRFPYFGSIYMKSHRDSGTKGRILNQRRKDGEITEEEYKLAVAQAKKDNTRQTKEDAIARKIHLTLEDLRKLDYREVMSSRYNKGIRDYRNERQ